jgi:MYXO-CTERM domain-containing protein
LTLGGTMHDVAISAWGVKGWYDYIRPVSAIRALAALGQSSDEAGPSYHPGGLNLHPGYIEVVTAQSSAPGQRHEHLVDDIGKIALYAWRGPDFIPDPEVDEAGVGWILAENWWPYQRPSFVTPPFAGYVSGHSTYSRAASEMMTIMTGSPYFPGGMGIFPAPQNEFLVFEEGPSQYIELQWATYYDASDQTSLSRIWGGIHPPADDLPGRHMGQAIARDAVAHAQSIFGETACSDLVDNDEDGLVDLADDGCADASDDSEEWPDTDGDGLRDDEEIAIGTNINLPDTDSDGMGDGFEVLHGLDPLVNDAGGDLDSDTHTNKTEHDYGTSPSNPNSFPQPTIFLNQTNVQIVLGDTATLLATATHANGVDDVTSSLVWSASNGAGGAGGTFAFTPTALGLITVDVTVTDGAGFSRQATVWVDVLAEPPPPPPDAGPAPDAGPPDSGSAPDAGPAPDSGSVMDAGPAPDAGQRMDAAVMPDAGPVVDAGPAADDAGSAPDAGTAMDTDSGPVVDADSGLQEDDAGAPVDAGPAPPVDAGTVADAGPAPANDAGPATADSGSDDGNDADPPATGTTGSGCDCRSSGTAPAPFFVFAILLLGLRRRSWIFGGRKVGC